MKNNLKFKIQNSKLGFTLTEILIVVVIIGLLGTLALPQVLKTMEKANVGEAISNLNLIRTAEKMYYLENSFYIDDDAFQYLNIDNPNDSSTKFDYSIDSVSANNFSAKATRNSGSYAYDYFIDKDGVITSNGPFI